jgi:predicted metalloprotease
MLRKVAYVVGLMAVLVVLGCGSSDESTEGTTEATTPPSAETDVLDQLPQVPAPTEATAPPGSLREVFDDAQAMWRQEFEDAGSEYTPATLTIFRDEVDTACGAQSANVGPFYCPADHGVYLDTRFFDALGRAAGVHLGDFAQAYVVAHEVGHHVQTLLGVMQRVRGADEQDPAGANARSVRLELQADCFAGVWAHSRYQRGQLSQADHGAAVLRLVMDLVEAGFGERLLLSQDVGQMAELGSRGGRGYAYVATRFLPVLRDAGADDAMVQMLTVENPRRWLTIAG